MVDIITTYIYLDIISITSALMVAIQTLYLFSFRYYHKKNIMNLTGIIASLCALIFTIFKYIYWFNGITKSFTCDVLIIGIGILQGATVNISLLHLFLRSEAINKINPKWKIWRMIGILFMLLSIFSSTIYVILREYNVVLVQNVYRCAFTLNIIALQMKFLTQCLNHMCQTCLFVYPLIVHIKRMQEFSILHSSIYKEIAIKAIIGMIVSTLFTIVVTILIFCYNINSIPIAALSVFDMALTLGSVCFVGSNAILLPPRQRTLNTSFQLRRASV